MQRQAKREREKEKEEGRQEPPTWEMRRGRTGLEPVIERDYSGAAATGVKLLVVVPLPN